MATTLMNPPEQHQPFYSQLDQYAATFPEKKMLSKEESLSDDQQHMKDELIQQATSRLRRRLLEEKLLDVLNEVSRMQTLLETVRIEAVTTAEAITRVDENKERYDLDALEKRLKNHWQQLEQLKGPSIPSSLNVSKSTSTALTLSTSLSSTLSRISSIFSQRPIKIHAKCERSKETESTMDVVMDVETDQDDMSDCCSQSLALSLWKSKVEDIDCNPMITDEEALKRSNHRRRRVKQLREQYLKQLQLYDPMWPSHESKSTKSVHSTESYISEKQSTSALSNAIESIAQKIPITKPKRNSMTLLSSSNGPCSPRIGQNLTTNLVGHRQTYFPSPTQLSSNQPWDSHSRSAESNGDYFIRTHSPPLYFDHMAICENFMGVENQAASLSPYALESWLTEQTMDCDSSVEWTEHEFDRPLPGRNILEDALSFLDAVGEDGDDGGFGDDMEFLLGHPDLCSRSLTEVRDTMSKYKHRKLGLQSQQQHYRQLSPSIILWPSTWFHWGSQLLNVGQRWCRFFTILCLTIVISLCSGPGDMKDNADNEESIYGD